MNKRLFRFISIGSAIASTGVAVSFVVSCGNASTNVKIGGTLESRTLKTLDQWQKDYASYAWSKTAIADHKVQQEAFANQELPANFYLPDDVTEIGYKAFYNAKFKDSATLPYKLEVIDRQAFQKAQLPDNFVVPRDLRSIGLKAFGDLQIPKGFQLDPFTKQIVLNENAFSGSTMKNYGDDKNPHLATISLTTFLALKISGISQDVIAKDESLGGIIRDWTFPNKLVDIPNKAFLNADLTATDASQQGRPKFVIPKWIKNIGWSSFSGAKLPRDFVVPENVMSLAYESFGNLTLPDGFTVKWSNAMPSVDNSAFNNSKFDDTHGTAQITKKTFDVIDGHGMDNELRPASGASRIKLQSIYKDANKTLDSTMVVNGKLLDNAFENFDFTTSEGQKELANIFAETSITEIGAKAFKGARFDSTSIISSSVKKIGYQAFAEATFTKDLTIPSSVTFVDEYAFTKIKMAKDKASGAYPKVVYDSAATISNSAFSFAEVTETKDNTATLITEIKALASSNTYLPASKIAELTKDLDTKTDAAYVKELQTIKQTLANDSLKFEFGPAAKAGLKEIGQGAFGENILDNTFATSFVQLAKLESIKPSAFSATVFKDKLTIGASDLPALKTLGVEAFSSTVFKQGVDLSASPIIDFGARTFQNAIIGNWNITYDAQGKEVSRELHDKTATGYVDFKLPTKLTSVAINMFTGVDFTAANNFTLTSTNVETIRNGAFSDTVLNPSFDLEHLTSLKEIGDNAFTSSGRWLANGYLADYSKFTNFTVPSSVISIGQMAFANAILPTNFTLGHLAWANVKLGGGVFTGSEIPVGFALPHDKATDNTKILPGGIFKAALIKGTIGNIDDVTHMLAEAFSVARFASNSTFTLKDMNDLHYVGASAFAMTIVPTGFKLPAGIMFNEMLSQAFFKTSINTGSKVSTEIDPDTNSQVKDANGRDILIYTDVPVKWGKTANDPVETVGVNGNPLPGSVAWIPTSPTTQPVQSPVTP